MEEKKPENEIKAGEEDEWVEDPPSYYDGDIINLNVGDSIKGTLVAVKKFKKEGDPKDRFYYVLKEDGFDRPKILFGKTILNQVMAKKKIGDRVIIERIPDKKATNGFPMHNFKSSSLKKRL